MLLGEKDDNLPVAKVQGYGAYARAAGEPAPIETVIYLGAYDACTVPSLVTLRFYRSTLAQKVLGLNRPAFLVDGRAKPFDPSSFGACLGEAARYSMAYETVRAPSIAGAVRLLRIRSWRHGGGARQGLRFRRGRAGALCPLATVKRCQELNRE